MEYTGFAGMKWTPAKRQHHKISNRPRFMVTIAIVMVMSSSKKNIGNILIQKVLKIDTNIYHNIWIALYLYIVIFMSVPKIG